MDASLAWSGILTGLMACAHLHLAHHLGTRSVTPDTRAAWLGFRAWWLGTGVVFATGAAVLLLAAAGAIGVEILVTQAILARLAMSGAAAGLVFYVLFLYTGRASAWVPLALGYLAHCVFSVGVLMTSRPTHVDLAPWAVPVLVGTTPLTAAFLASASLLMGPPLVAIVAYVRLRRVVTSPLQRCRIALVGVGTLAWFVPSIVAYVAYDVEWLQIVSRLLGLVGAGLALVAYHPPGRLVTRFGARGMEEGAAVAASLTTRA